MATPLLSSQIIYTGVVRDNEVILSDYSSAIGNYV